jgi:hypothetical protein
MRNPWPLLVVLLVASCTGRSDQQSAAPASTVAPPTTTVPPTTISPTTATASRLPSGLEGAWSSSEGDATLAYRFSADGSYRHAGLLTQPRATGVFEFTVVERGTVTVRGSRMTLEPTAGTTTRKDPDDPGGDYERPISREPRRLTWRLDSSGGRDVLYLKDEDGVEVSYDRE